MVAASRQPSLAFYDLSGKRAVQNVQNEGVAPDIEVEYRPAEVINGHDPQLERAVQEALSCWTESSAPSAAARADRQSIEE
jgi:tricorn protease